MQKAKLYANSKLKEGDLFGYYTDQLGALEPRVKITPNDSQNYFYYHFAIVRDYDEHPKKYPMLIELTEDGFFVDLLTGTKLSFVPPEKTLSPYVTKGTVNYNDLVKSQYEKKLDDLKDTPLVIVQDELWQVDDAFKCAYAKTTLADIEGYTERLETEQKIAKSRFEKNLAIVANITTPVEDAIAKTEEFIQKRKK